MSIYLSYFASFSLFWLYILILLFHGGVRNASSNLLSLLFCTKEKSDIGLNFNNNFAKTGIPFNFNVLILISYFPSLVLLQSNAVTVQSTSSFNESKLKGSEGFPLWNYRFQTCTRTMIECFGMFGVKANVNGIVLSTGEFKNQFYYLRMRFVPYFDLITKSMYELSNYYRKSCLWNSEWFRQVYLLIKFLLLWFQITNHVRTIYIYSSFA